MNAEQPFDIVDIVIEMRYEHQRTAVIVGRQPGNVQLVAACEHVVL